MNHDHDLFTPNQVSDEWLQQFLVPSLIAAKPYKIDTTTTPVKLDQTENPWDWPERIKDKIIT